MRSRRGHGKPGPAEDSADRAGPGGGQVEEPAGVLHAVVARVRDEAEHDRDVDELTAGREPVQDVRLLPRERLRRAQSVQLEKQLDGHAAGNRVDEARRILRSGIARVRAKREKGTHRLRGCKRHHLVPRGRHRCVSEEIVADGCDLAGRVSRQRPLPPVERVRGMAQTDRVGGERCECGRGEQVVERLERAGCLGSAAERVVNHDEIVAVGHGLHRLVAEVCQRTVVPVERDLGMQPFPRFAAGSQGRRAPIVIPAEPAQGDPIQSCADHQTRNLSRASSSSSRPRPGAVGSTNAPSTIGGSVCASAPRMIMCL